MINDKVISLLIKNGIARTPPSSNGMKNYGEPGIALEVETIEERSKGRKGVGDVQ
jgi:hypothetical protein